MYIYRHLSYFIGRVNKRLQINIFSLISAYDFLPTDCNLNGSYTKNLHIMLHTDGRYSYILFITHAVYVLFQFGSAFSVTMILSYLPFLVKVCGDVNR